MKSCVCAPGLYFIGDSPYETNRGTLYNDVKSCVCAQYILSVIHHTKPTGALSTAAQNCRATTAKKASCERSLVGRLAITPLDLLFDRFVMGLIILPTICPGPSGASSVITRTFYSETQ